MLSPEVYIGAYQEVDSTNRAAKAVAVSGEAGHGSFVWPQVRAPDAADGAGVSIRRRYGGRLSQCDPSTEGKHSGKFASRPLKAAVAIYKAVKRSNGNLSGYQMGE